MTTTRKTSIRKHRQRDEDFARQGETCDLPDDKKKKGQRKPDCPDGYPHEHPKEKPTGEAKK